MVVGSGGGVLEAEGACLYVHVCRVSSGVVMRAVHEAVDMHRQLQQGPAPGTRHQLRCQLSVQGRLAAKCTYQRSQAKGRGGERVEQVYRQKQEEWLSHCCFSAHPLSTSMPSSSSASRSAPLKPKPFFLHMHRQRQSDSLTRMHKEQRHPR
jgi:hypothetical protein